MENIRGPDGGRGRGRSRGGGGRSSHPNQGGNRGGGGGRGYYQNQSTEGGDHGDYQNPGNRGGGGDRGNYQHQSSEVGGQNRGGRGGRGNYQHQSSEGGGQGDYPNPGNRGGGGGRGYYQQQSSAGGGGGRAYNQNAGNRGIAGRDSYQNQSNQGGNIQNEPYQGGRGGGGRGNFQSQPGAGGRGWGGRTDQPAENWVNRPQAQQEYKPAPQQPPQQTWTGRPWGPSTSAQLPQHQPSAADELCNIVSQKLQLPASPESNKEQIQPIKRPDQGGKLAIRSVRLLVNHFPVGFDPKKTIIHYDVDIKPVSSNGREPVKKSVRKSDLRLIKDKLFSDDSRFASLMTAYDGEKNIYSAVSLPTGQFRVDIADEDVKSGSYMFTIKFVNELPLLKLGDYLKGNLSYVPRDILQGMDLVMKENPSRQRISVGRGFYSKNFRREDDLRCGVAAYRGFQSSLKPTSQGLVLCLDYSTLAFRKPLPVIDFLKEHIPRFQVNEFKRFRRNVEDALRGLKVTVTHRKTKQKYTVVGLAKEDTCDCYFELLDPEGVNPPQNINLVRYFKEKWDKDIMHQNIPCLEVGKGNRSNQVPIEFCVLVEGQRFDKDNLDRDGALLLKNLTLVKPWVRQNTINEMVRAKDGPCGDVSRNFTIEVDVNMTRVVGRVIGAPELKIGASRSVRVDADKCQWNLVNKSVVDGKYLERWAIIDFTDGDRYNNLQVDAFVDNLRGRCRNLGIRTEEPLAYRLTRMNELASTNRLEKLFTNIVMEAGRINPGKLQLIVCAMTRKDPGYKTLKLISETKIGVVTQCLLSGPANKANDQYLANLGLKINAKLGGSNFELTGKLPHFEPQDRVMFIGADVNHPHPGPMNASSPSIAAVVATVNWPAANRYAARVSPQANRVEKILNFGKICVDLVENYAKLNKVRPNKIVIFRDGVSEAQFQMVLGEELIDLKRAFGDYEPKITLIVAQKRHQTRLFVENKNDGGATGNIPPGTVVDTKIIHPFDFDFYLASHYGGIGTSKPTHYHVLWDENLFTSDELQKLIYDMCFTFARCTKPVSLVPPVYYADLVAYRGRYFQEALMESGAYSDSVPFDASLYNLHSDLKNVMFFV